MTLIELKHLIEDILEEDYNRRSLPVILVPKELDFNDYPYEKYVGCILIDQEGNFSVRNM